MNVDMADKLTLEEEKQLIEKAKTDWSAFEVLYNQYVAEIYYYLMNRVGSKELAEDITSETFAKAMENIKKFQWKGVPFRAWLYKIAINCANQHYHRNNKEIAVDIDNLAGIKGDDGRHISEDIDRDLEKEKLRAAIGKISEKERTIIDLRYFQELDYAEIAEIMNMSVSLVGVRIHRILKKLQAQI